MNVLKRAALSNSEVTLIAAFLLGKSAGMMVCHNGFNNHWTTLFASLVILVLLFGACNLYCARGEKS